MELTGPRPSMIIDALAAAGIPLNATNLSTRRHIGYRSTTGSSGKWALKSDSSVDGEGLELVSPLLQGEDGFAQLERVCAALSEVGATVSSRCGLHVHHDFRNLSATTTVKQVVAFVERQSIIEKLVAPSRRADSSWAQAYCKQWGTQALQSLRAITNLSSMSYLGPRGFINVQSYAVHGSVEVRAHAGTISYKKIAAWVRFGQALFAAAAVGANVSQDDVKRMLLDLEPFGVTTEDAAWLLRFETAGSTRTAVQRQLEEQRLSIATTESVLEEVR
jgi:hypothetical protein